MSTIKILGIHGLGDHRDGQWIDDWEKKIARCVSQSGVKIEFVPFSYDEIYEEIDISALEASTAFVKLAASGITSAASNLIDNIGGLFGRRSVPQAGTRGVFSSTKHFLEWYAGYVVAWLEDDRFRARVRKRLLKTIGEEKPDVVLAHSLGSLISYDALSSHEDIARHPKAKKHLQRMTYVTLGSQIGNPFVVRNLTPGRIEALPVKQWSHLYNREDDVFTAEIRLPGVANFIQTETFFDIDGWKDHSATHYLSHPATIRDVWQPLALQHSAAPAARALGKSMSDSLRSASARRAARSETRRRALLVGINEYPEPDMRLQGCVNDTFLMSSVLQECKFEPEQMRVVLNDRATSSAILERLHWLVDDAAPGDELVFYYSGHGAQLPTYGAGDSVDQMDETLVPWDFDWSPERCITDDQIYNLYSQLPYDTRLVMIFDCYHSGGIHRDPGVRVRGLTAPDDVRHRAMKWCSKEGMWLPREISQLNGDFSKDQAVNDVFTGQGGSLRRIGRAMHLRGDSAEGYARRKKDRLKASEDAPVGPYLPLIMEACQEHQYAYEYRHGVESYGAYTYSLAAALRKAEKISFKRLTKKVTRRLKKLGYDQKPAILGPTGVMQSQVPWS